MNDICWQTAVIGFRKSLEISQEKFAKLLKVERRSVGKYESGERTPNTEIQKRIIKLIKDINFDIYYIIL